MKVKIFFLLIFFVLGKFSADAQSESSLPPFVNSFAVNDSFIFAGTSKGGIFLSDDNGNHWKATNNGLSNKNVLSLTAHEKNIFAGTLGGGIFLSTNNGKSWTKTNTGLTNTNVWSLTIDGINIYAGTEGGIFLSINNGNSWFPINVNLTNNKRVNSLAVKNQNIFVGIGGGGIAGGGTFLTNNNGNSWTAINNGLPSFTDKWVKCLIVNGDYLFAGTNGGGVYLSNNNGGSWKAINAGLTNLYVRSIILCGTNILVGTQGGIFLSTNNGENWSPINNGLPNTKVNAIAIYNSNILVGTIGDGIFLSNNNGSSWVEKNNGLTIVEEQVNSTSGNINDSKNSTELKNISSNSGVDANATTIKCSPPHRYYISINSTKVKVSWGNLGDSVTYNFQYQIAGKSKKYSEPSSWNYINNIRDTSVTLTELKPNSKYFYQVQTVCPHSSSVINTEGYSDFNSFETQQDENYLPNIEEYAGVWEDYNFATAAYGIYYPTYRIVIDTSNTVTFYSKGAMQNNLNLNCQMKFSLKALIKGIDQNYYRYTSSTNGDCKYFIEIFPPKPESKIQKFQSGEWRTEIIPAEPMKLYLCFEDWRKPLFSKTQVDIEQTEQQGSNVIYKWKK